jgi:hypothetical protein
MIARCRGVSIDILRRWRPPQRYLAIRTKKLGQGKGPVSYGLLGMAPGRRAGHCLPFRHDITARRSISARARSRQRRVGSVALRVEMTGSSCRTEAGTAESSLSNPKQSDSSPVNGHTQVNGSAPEVSRALAIRKFLSLRDRESGRARQPLPRGRTGRRSTGRPMIRQPQVARAITRPRRRAAAL